MTSTPDKAAPGPRGATRLYFAWSPVLDPAERAAWMKRHGHDSFHLPEGVVAELSDMDLVYRHPSARWGGRVAALARKPGVSVVGLLLEVPVADWPILQHAEGVKSGKCLEMEVEVNAGGRKVKATTFSPRPELATREGLVSQRYADALARAARQARLPEAYVTKLEAEAMILQRVQSTGERLGLK